MNNKLLQIYHLLPDYLKSAFASIHGAKLRRIRYDDQTENRVKLARERESWRREKWEGWQDKILAFVLKEAVRKVPFYMNYWEKQKHIGNHDSSDYLANWPILKKEELRKKPEDFVLENLNIKTLYCDRTSGSTGTPLKVWLKKETVGEWYSLFEARCREWNGVSRHDRWGILGGQLVVPFNRTKPPYWVWNAGLNQLYMSSYHISPVTASEYLSAIKKYKLKYLLGYPSSLYSLARFAINQGLDAPKLMVVISNAEPLFQNQRETISKAFRCKVRDTYGAAEAVVAASECDHGKLHIWPEVGIIEVLKDESDEPAEPGEMGRLICTGLLNAAMPLIRYEIGDRGSILEEESNCPCGRKLPVMGQIDGRIDDVVVTKDGRRIGRLDPAFKSDFPIREAQIVQEELDRLIVKFVPSNGYNQKVEKEIESALCERVGDMQIFFEKVEEIPRTKNGKFRAVVSNLNASV